MPDTRVISLKGRQAELGRSLEHAPADLVYVGRRMTMGGWLLPGSRFANPYTVKECGSAEQAVEYYRSWLCMRPDLVAAARRELAGRLLACWCKPDQPCHARFLADWLDGRETLPEPSAPEFGRVLFGNDMGGRHVATVRLRGEAAVLL